MTSEIGRKFIFHTLTLPFLLPTVHGPNVRWWAGFPHVQDQDTSNQSWYLIVFQLYKHYKLKNTLWNERHFPFSWTRPFLYNYVDILYFVAIFDPRVTLSLLKSRLRLGSVPCITDLSGVSILIQNIQFY